MKEKLLEKCAKERKELIRACEVYQEDKKFQRYADMQNEKIRRREVIIEILCGMNGMTPRIAEEILDDTKRLIESVARDQPM